MYRHPNRKAIHAATDWARTLLGLAAGLWALPGFAQPVDDAYPRVPLFETELPFQAYADTHFPEYAEASGTATDACNRNVFKPAMGWRYWVRFADGPARVAFGHVAESLIDLEGIREPELMYLFQEVLPPDCAVIAVDNPVRAPDD